MIHHPLLTARTIVERSTDVAVLLLMVLLLLIAIPAMATIAVPTDIGPRPLPAPGPEGTLVLSNLAIGADTDGNPGSARMP